MSGWFATKREIFEHPIFHKRHDRLYVWQWMIANAAWKDTRQDAGGRPVDVKRGQLMTSYRQIERATGVGVQVIRTMIDLLKAEHAINTDTSNGRMVITICNYDKYQSPDGVDNTSTNTPPTHRQHTKRTREQIPTTSEAPASPAPEAENAMDPAKILFTQGVKTLTAGGVKEASARSLIGRWRQSHGDAAVLAAFGRAQREGAMDPVAFIEGCFRFDAAKRPNHPEIGEIRIIGGKRKKYAGNGTGWLVVHD